MMNESHRFKKKYGQNFLRDNSVIDKIISFSTLTKDDLVIEIGPGDGALTKKLLKYSKVLAYEVDRELKEKLENIDSDLNVVWDDFLIRDVKRDLKSYKYNNLFLIANLPYYITTPIVLKIINEEIEFKEIIIMVQKEVADRFSSSPGCRDYSSITVLLNYYFEIEKLFSVSRNSFFPVPNVDSAVIKLIRKKEKIYVKNEELFFKFVRDCFRFKRKTLKNNVRNYDLNTIEKVLKTYNFDLTVRAEQLSLDIFAEIVNNLEIEAYYSLGE